MNRPRSSPRDSSRQHFIDPSERNHNDQRLFEQQNDLRMEDLAGKVSALRQVTVDIHGQVLEQNRLIDETGGTFGSFNTLLGGTMKRLKVMTATRHSRNMCYMVGALVFSFFVIWFLLNRTSIPR